MEQRGWQKVQPCHIPCVYAFRIEDVGKQEKGTQPYARHERPSGLVVARVAVVRLAHVEPAHGSHNKAGGHINGRSQAKEVCG